MDRTLLSLFVIFTLLFSGSCLNWQGTGNMSRQNMTQVWNFILANFNTSWTKATLTATSDTTLLNFTKVFSDHLNDLWAPAWNVFVAYITDGSNDDSVVYGYAFRDHWFWYNGYRTNDGFYVAFIIWKDYNCITWFSLNPNAPSFNPQSYDTSASSGLYKTSIKPIHDSVQSNHYDLSVNVWQAVFDYGNAYATDPSTSNYAFTIIGIKSDANKFYGRFCAKDYSYSNTLGESSVQNQFGMYDIVGWGRIVILQTR